MAEISLDPDKKAIVITDDGHGNDRERYQRKGYRHSDWQNHHKNILGKHEK